MDTSGKNSQIVFNNCLVLKDGRFRLPGTQFMSHRNFNSNGLRSDRNISAMSNFTDNVFSSKKSESVTKLNNKEVSKSKSKPRKLKKLKFKKGKGVNKEAPKTTHSFFNEGCLVNVNLKSAMHLPDVKNTVESRKSPKKHSNRAKSEKKHKNRVKLKSIERNEDIQERTCEDTTGMEVKDEEGNLEVE